MPIATGIALIIGLIICGAGVRFYELFREKKRRARRARRRIRNIAHAKAWYDIFQRPRMKRLPSHRRDWSRRAIIICRQHPGPDASHRCAAGRVKIPPDSAGCLVGTKEEHEGR